MLTNYFLLPANKLLFAQQKSGSPQAAHSGVKPIAALALLSQESMLSLRFFAALQLSCVLCLVPLPRSLHNPGTTQLSLIDSPQFFTFESGLPLPPLLERAFLRYRQFIFANRSYTPPASDAGLLGTVAVSVSNLSAPLQLYFNESYTLKIDTEPPSASINAATVWGALRGLETLSQLVSPAPKPQNPDPLNI